jgi:hypothetical protein
MISILITPFSISPRHERIINSIQWISRELYIFAGDRHSFLSNYQFQKGKDIIVSNYFNNLRQKKVIMDLIMNTKDNVLFYIFSIRAIYELLPIMFSLKYRESNNVRTVVDIGDLLHKGNYYIDYTASRATQLFLSILKPNLFICTSPKYSSFLPRFIPYLLMENIPAFYIRRRLKLNGRPNDSGLGKNITFLGGLWYKKQIALLILFGLKNPSFNIRIFGGPEENIKDILRILKIKELPRNISYYGPYNYNKVIVDIYKETGIVYSVYDSSILNVRLALPNKLYESVFARRPIIVADGTYLSEVVRSNNLGISVPSDLVQYDRFEYLIKICSKEIHNYMNEEYIDILEHNAKVQETTFRNKLGLLHNE